MLRDGVGFEETVNTVFEATKGAVAGDPRAARWNWAKELNYIGRMCSDFIVKNPELLRLPAVAAARGVRAGDRRGARARLRPSQGSRLVVCVQARVRAQGAASCRLRPPPPARAGNGGDPDREPDLLPIGAIPFKRFDPTTLQGREWLYGGHYQCGIVTATVGAGGVGKSSLNLVELIAICTGRPLLGEQPVMRCKAWYHNAEERENDIYLRIAAICQHYDIDQDELEGWLFVTSGITMPIKIAVSRGGTAHVDKATTAAIVRTITDNEIRVASFDPLVAHHAAIENATGDMDVVIREFARIANATESSIEIVHHTRKPAPGQEELGVVDSRGAGAIVNAVRSARVLNPMSKSEADGAGIDDVDRQLHFRVDRGKSNMAPPTAARWYKFIGVDLPNMTADNIGVATPWVFPGQAGAPTEELAAAERKADDMFMSLLVRFTNEGRRVGASPSASYAPSRLCQGARCQGGEDRQVRPGRSHGPAIRGQPHPGGAGIR